MDDQLKGALIGIGICIVLFIILLMVKRIMWWNQDRKAWKLFKERMNVVDDEYMKIIIDKIFTHPEVLAMIERYMAKDNWTPDKYEEVKCTCYTGKRAEDVNCPIHGDNGIESKKP